MFAIATTMSIAAASGQLQAGCGFINIANATTLNAYESVGLCFAELALCALRYVSMEPCRRDPSTIHGAQSSRLAGGGGRWVRQCLCHD